MGKVNKVFNALGNMLDSVYNAEVKMVKGLAKTTGFGAGVTEATSIYATGLASDVYNIVSKSFKSTISEGAKWDAKSIKHEMVQTLKSGRIIPLKLKGTTAAIGLGAAGIYGVEQIALGGNNTSKEGLETLSLDPSIQEAYTPNSLGKTKSPKIDNMSADGNIVLASHRGR